MRLSGKRGCNGVLELNLHQAFDVFLDFKKLPTVSSHVCPGTGLPVIPRFAGDHQC